MDSASSVWNPAAMAESSVAYSDARRPECGPQKVCDLGCQEFRKLSHLELPNQ